MASSISSDGILLSNYQEYKDFLSRQYHPNWAKKDNVTDNRIKEVFGLPKRFPVVLTLRVNSLDAWNNKGIHFIYLEKKPSTYTYRESAWD